MPCYPFKDNDGVHVIDLALTKKDLEIGLVKVVISHVATFCESNISNFACHNNSSFKSNFTRSLGPHFYENQPFTPKSCNFSKS